MRRIKEGFSGQQLIILPEIILQGITESFPISLLHLTHIGYFPEAAYHFVERPEGARQYILIYCVAGSGEFEVAGRKGHIGKNQFVVLPAGVAHRYAASGETPWSIHFLHFNGESADEVYQMLSNSQPLDDPKSALINIRKGFFSDMYRCLESGYTADNFSYVCNTLWRLIGTFLYPRQFIKSHTTMASTPAEKSIHFMTENLDKSLTLAEMATSANYSVPHFSAVFKQETGYSPMDYFIRLKIQRACQFLNLTDIPVKLIAGKLGFQDPYYFSRLFRKIMGESPLGYRRREQK